MMRTIKMVLQYDGTRYNGWQKQKNTHRTIQAILEKILTKLLKEPINVTGAGRTDAGVHALGQVAHFKTGNLFDLARLQPALNALLPDDIRVSALAEESPFFHSRYGAAEKTYRYTILNRSYHDVFSRNFSCLLGLPLNVAKMRLASRVLLGEHDFSAFRKTDHRFRRSNVRTIRSISISREKDYIYIDITGKSFMYNMVRNIAGTLIEVGRGKRSAQSVQAALSSRNRRTAGPTAPACGLCLLKIRY